MTVTEQDKLHYSLHREIVHNVILTDLNGRYLKLNTPIRLNITYFLNSGGDRTEEVFVTGIHIETANLISRNSNGDMVDGVYYRDLNIGQLQNLLKVIKNKEFKIKNQTV